MRFFRMFSVTHSIMLPLLLATAFFGLTLTGCSGKPHENTEDRKEELRQEGIEASQREMEEG